MKKRILLSMAFLTAVTAGSVSLTSYAAGGTVQVWSGRNYKVYSGQGIKSLQETLQELGITGSGAGSGCPGSGVPGAGSPELPKPPASDADTPGTELPGVQEPGTETPGAETLSYAEQVVKLVNEERAKAGLSPVTVQTDITAAANVRAREIRQKFSHTRPDGSSYSSALSQQGVSYRGSGENIAYGQSTPEQVMQGWMDSSGHRANILNANYKNIGVGYYQDERGVNHWVQLFTY